MISKETLIALNEYEIELLFAHATTEEYDFRIAVAEYLAEGNRITNYDNGYGWDWQNGWHFLWTSDAKLAEFLVARNLRVVLND